MAKITRQLEGSKNQIVTVGDQVRAGVKLIKNPDFSYVYDTARNLLAKLLPGEEYTCPDTPTGDGASGCSETDVVPTWAVFNHSTGSGGVKTWNTVHEADYFASPEDECFIAVLLDSEI